MAGSESLAEALSRVPLFRGLSRRELEYLALGAEDLDARAGRVLIGEGESGRQFFVIVSGSVVLTKSGEHVRTLGPGDFFGETSLVDHEPSRTTATAETAVRFFVLPSQSFWSLVRRNPTVHCRVLEDLVVENIMERRTAEVQWRRQVEVNAYEAVHDALTGLPNRVLFFDRAEHALAQGKRDQRLVSIALLDLDRFKEVNDTLGHEAGDILLKGFSSRLQKAVREGDTVARLGGDEFALVFVTETTAEVESAIERLKVVMEPPFSIHGLSIGVEASIGVAFYPEHGFDAETLLRHADLAMYAAKETRAGHTFFDPTRNNEDAIRLTLVDELRKAIRENELTLHYQPKAALTTGDVTSVEALVRWQHPTRGLIGPDEFIPVVEQTTLVKPLTLWVLNEAIRQCRAWEDEGLELSMAVNLSPRNLLDDGFPHHVAELLKNWALSPGRLELEITESAIVSDLRLAKSVLDRLAGMGITLSVDDFGTGYSSLSHLKELPVRELKIDRSFIQRMSDNQEDATIVRSMIELAKNLGLNVVAEGVESAEVLNELRELGCNSAQGYLLSRPIEPGELSRLLLARANDRGDRVHASHRRSSAA